MTPYKLEFKCKCGEKIDFVIEDKNAYIKGVKKGVRAMLERSIPYWVSNKEEIIKIGVETMLRELNLNAEE